MTALDLRSVWTSLGKHTHTFKIFLTHYMIYTRIRAAVMNTKLSYKKTRRKKKVAMHESNLIRLRAKGESQNSFGLFGMN